MNNKNVNETLTAELERYKDQVIILKEENNVDKVSDSCAQFMEIDDLKQTLSEHLKEKESLKQTVTLLKNDFQKEESRNIDRELALEKHIKELNNIYHSENQCQKKLNLTKPDTYKTDLKRKEAYTNYSNPSGYIYQNKDKQNRLMRIYELHKFSDDTLNDFQTALDDRLKGIRMKYLPQTNWRRSDKERAATMIQAIDKQLNTRRIIRSLERFIGGRLYEEDFRMLQRTI
nr:hypothetical protein [Tanacetum cinerariifolium]